MKFLLIILLTLPALAQIKDISPESFKLMDEYRQKSLNGFSLPEYGNLTDEQEKEQNIKIQKLDPPYQKLPYYIWGLLKKNRKLKYLKEEQIEQLKALVEKFKSQRGRLHDERNYCRIRYLMAAYKNAVSKGTEHQQQMQSWLQLWLKYKADEEAVGLQFIREEWSIFTDSQQQAILKNEWKDAVKPIKDYNRTFSGDKQLLKIFKFKTKGDENWLRQSKKFHSEMTTLREKYLLERSSYNKAFFHVDQILQPYALKKAGRMNKLLSDIYSFNSLAMQQIMRSKLTDQNKKEFDSKLNTFLEKMHGESLKKYGTEGNAGGLIKLTQ